jgi:hypothetical protein
MLAQPIEYGGLCGAVMHFEAAKADVALAAARPKASTAAER